MKQRFTLTLLFVLPLFFLAAVAQAQEQRDTAFRVRPNAGFDVIIKRNGELVYGLVKEVGPVLIRYQRTDIPDGPIYTIPRVEVYAISYRNQVKDVLNPPDGFVSPGDSLNPQQSWRRRPYPPDQRRMPYRNEHREPGFSFTRDGQLRIGFGFFRGYTNVDNAGDYETSASFPTVTVAYDVLYRNNVRLGAQVAVGQRKFSRQEFDLYDSLQTNTDLKENIFAIDVYARYMLTRSQAQLQPYLTGGVGLHTSFIHSNQEISFLERTDQVILVKSGRRSANIGLLARIGADYFFTPQLRAFADGGFGPTILQVGVGFSVQ